MDIGLHSLLLVVALFELLLSGLLVGFALMAVIHARGGAPCFNHASVGCRKARWEAPSSFHAWWLSTCSRSGASLSQPWPIPCASPLLDGRRYRTASRSHAFAGCQSLSPF